MTVDQYMALDDLDGLNATTSKVILTGLTQAHIDAGFTLTDTDTLVGTVTLAESVVLKATTDLNGFTVVMSGTQTLSLATSTQADGLDIEGTATNTVQFQFWQLDSVGSVQDTRIDASGYNVGTLKAMQTFFLDMPIPGGNNSGEENVEYVVDSLKPSVTLVIVNDPTELGMTGYNRNIVLEAGTRVPGEMVVNNTDVNKELITLDLTLSGDARIMGNLRIPAQEQAVGSGKFAQYFRTLTINSTASATSTVNRIDGWITPMAFVPANPAVVTTEADNNLTKVIINASEDLVIRDGIVFN